MVVEGQGADELLAGYDVNVFPHAFIDLMQKKKFSTAVREFTIANSTLGKLRNVGRARFLAWIEFARCFHHCTMCIAVFVATSSFMRRPVLSRQNRYAFDNRRTNVCRCA